MEEEKMHCPVCGSKKNTFFVEGGTDWNPGRCYICEGCKIEFSVGTGEFAREYLRNV